MDKQVSITGLPFYLPGRIFRSPMPFSIYDPGGNCLTQFKLQNVTVIVLLAEKEEYLERTGRNLESIYKQEGFQVIHLPMPDFGVVPKRELEEAVEETINHAKAGRNIAIHCHAGHGRTGLFVALLAKKVLGLRGEEAIDWTRTYIPDSLQSDERRRLVIDAYTF